MTKKPPMPTYDPAQDGNIYSWIINQSKVVREQRQQVSQRQRLNPADLELLRKYDAEIEREDDQRLRSLRAQYDQSRNRTAKKVA